MSEGRRRYGAWSSRHGALPAGPLEELVTQQIVLALQTPHFVQAVVDRVRQVRPEIDEPQVALPMRNLAMMWKTLYPAEQRRLAQLLIERVDLAENGLETNSATSAGANWPAIYCPAPSAPNCKNLKRRAHETETSGHRRRAGAPTAGRW